MVFAPTRAPIDFGDAATPEDTTPPALANTSLVFGERNGGPFQRSMVSGAGLLQLFGNGTTGAEGAVCFFAQVQRAYYQGTNGVYPTGQSTVFGTATITGARAINCTFYGALSGNTGWAGRYCFFGKDQASANLIGRYQADGTDGGGTNRALRSIVIPDDEPRLVVLRRRDVAGTLTFDVITVKLDGTIEQGDTIAQTYVGNSTATSALSIGTFTGAAATLLNFFSGKLSNFAIIRGQGGSDADWQAVAKGRELKDVFTVGNIYLYRRLQDSSDVGAVSGYSGDGFAAFTVSGTGYRTGTSMRAHNDGTKWLKIDEPRDGIVAKALRRGDTSASITLSGKYSGSPSGIEVRLVKDSDKTSHKAWTAASIGGGTWSVTLTGVTPAWVNVEARFVGDTSVRVNGRNKFGIGWRMWMFTQSQGVICIDPETADSDTIAPANVSHTVKRRNALANYIPHLIHVRNAGDVADGAMALADTWNAIAPTVPLEVVWLSHEGTGVEEWYNDTVPEVGGPKLGSEYTQSLVDYSNECSAIFHLQGTSNSTDAAAVYQDKLDRWYGGTSSPTYTLAGKFSGTLPVVILGHCRHRDNVNATASASNAGNHNTFRKAQYDWVSLSLSGVAKYFGTWLHDYLIGSSSESTHQHITDARGNIRIGRRIACAMLAHAGLTNYSPLASITGATFNVGKTTITLATNLVNGGSLTTIGAASPTAIELSTDSGSTWSTSGFTTAVVGNTVVLTKSSGDWTAFSAGAVQVRYAYGWPAAIGSASYASETPLTDGFLVETRSDTGDVGAPLMPTFAALTVT